MARGLLAWLPPSAEEGDDAEHATAAAIRVAGVLNLIEHALTAKPKG